MKIAFFGTSLTGVNNWQTNSFVQNIDKEFSNYEVFNFGIGGANSYKVLSQIKEVSKNYKFDISFIEMGTNDILRKYQNRLNEEVSIEDFIDNYEKAIKELNKVSSQVICILSPAVSKDFEYPINPEIKIYNKSIRDLCKRKNIKYIDIFDKFINKDNLWTDGLHLNLKGDRIIAEEIKKVIDNG